MRMKKRVLDLWVEALRSGKYRQTTGALTHNREEFCCWGVACEVAIEDGTLVTYDESDCTYDGVSAYPPESVKEWMGYEDSGRVNTSQAANWNDDDQFSFSEIADLLEEKVETY